MHQQCILSLYRTEPEDYKTVADTIVTSVPDPRSPYPSVAMHTHSSMLRHTKHYTKGLIHPDHVLYSYMKKNCPMTEKYTLRERVGKSYMDTYEPMTLGKFNVG